jgi:hypothetical protein
MPSLNGKSFGIKCLRAARIKPLPTTEKNVYKCLPWPGIDGVGLNLAPVVIGPAMPLTLRLAANALLKSIRGWMKASLAVRTAAGFGQCVSSEIERDSNL